jgi:hypothetical protein
LGPRHVAFLTNWVHFGYYPDNVRVYRFRIIFGGDCGISKGLFAADFTSDNGRAQGFLQSTVPFQKLKEKKVKIIHFNKDFKI